MKSPNEVAELVMVEPTGARVFKADLHIHTNHSKEECCTMSVSEAIDAAVAKHLDMVSITDHNCCEGYMEAFRYIESKNYPIGLVPGVEISTGLTGVHLLAYFRQSDDPAGTVDRIRNTLVKLGIDLNAQRTDPHIAKTTLTPAAATKELSDAGAVVLVAHAEKVCNAAGRDKVDLLASNGVSGFELVGEPPEELRACVADKFALAGSDAHAANDVGGAVTYIRGERPDFDTLYAAATDPRSRIFASEPKVAYPYLEGVLIEVPAGAPPGGMLDGFVARFNPGLNCLIGERGTFKSSIINFIRAVIVPTAMDGGDELRERETKVVRDMLQGVLGEARIVHLMIAVAPGNYLVATGTHSRGTIQLRLQDAYCVSQAREPSESCPTALYMHDGIKARADDVTWLAGTVDKTIPGVEGFTAQERDILLKLQTNRMALNELSPHRTNKSAKEKDVEQLRQQRAALGVTPELATAVEWKEKVVAWFGDIKRQIDRAKGGMASLPAAIAINTPPALPPELSKAQEHLDIAQASAEAASKELGGLADIKKRIEGYSGTVETERAAVEAAFDAATDNRQLAGGGAGEAEKVVASYKKLGKNIAEAERVIGEETAALSDESRLLAERNGLLDELDRARDGRFALRDRQCAVRWRSGMITIGWRKRGNTVAYAGFVKAATSVRGLQDEEHRKPLVERITPRRLAALVRANGQASLASESGLQPHIAAKFLSECPKLAAATFELEEVQYDDAPDIRFDDQGTKKSLTELSAGQRATVLLKLILAGGDGPLVIDQPEDDIDNKVIYDEIVSDIRREKHRRQIIVATHQANIPVLGDAEKIVVLRSDGKRGYLRTQGCIESREVTEYVLRILEGGKDAIKRRYRRYHEEGLLD